MIVFTIPGTPVGKGRPRLSTRGGFARMHTPEKTAKYEKHVRSCAYEAMKELPPTSLPLAIEVYLFVAPPESWSNKKKLAALAGEILPTSVPDVDNCVKAITDGCNGVIWQDDKQIVDILARKRYGPKAEAVLIASELKAGG